MTLTSDPDFMVTFFDIEYLRNDTKWSHSYYRTSIGSHNALYRTVTFPMTLTEEPNPVFTVTAFLKSNIFLRFLSRKIIFKFRDKFSY